MPCFRRLLADHAPFLVVDTASARIQVGIFEGGARCPQRAGSAGDAAQRVGDNALHPGRWAYSDQEAGTGLFRCVESLGVELAAVRGFAFAEGPGSVLGIRIAAMALRTWRVLEPRPVFAYHALPLLAHALGRPELGLIADARREAWHFCRLGEPVRRVPAAELAGPLAMPEGFRHWSVLPPSVERVPYALAELLPRVADAELFRAVDEPDAFLSEAPRYATWTPQVHRAP